MKYILGNIVSNPNQAMPKGGKLLVQAHREARAVIITIRDTDVGIAEDAKDPVFTPLFTTESRGQGFGLAVVKRLTEAIGGTVTSRVKRAKAPRSP